MFSRRRVVAGLGILLVDGCSASCAIASSIEREFTSFEREGDQTADLAFRRAFDWVEHQRGGRVRLPANRVLLLDEEVSLPSGLELIGRKGAVVRQRTAGRRLFVGQDVANVVLAGFAVQGTGPKTLFDPEQRTDPDGVAPRTVTDAALVHFQSSRSGTTSDIIIRDVDFSDAFNLLCVRGGQRITIDRCSFSNWMLYAALASGSSHVTVADNRFEECAQSDGFTAYAFSATGDQHRGFPQRRLRFLRNLVRGVPSWDGFMSHEVDDLLVEDNEFYDVRNGIDVTTASGPIANVAIRRNRIFHAKSDPWRGRSAAHFSISVAADPVAPVIRNVAVLENLSQGANTVPGLSSGGYAIGAFVFSRVSALLVSGNRLEGVGNADSKLLHPKGFDGISIYEPDTDIVVENNTGTGTLDRFFVEISGRIQHPGKNIRVTGNSFTTTGRMPSLTRFASGRFEDVSVFGNYISSGSREVSEYQVEPGRAYVRSISRGR
jgi:hypothetical protein